MSRHSLLIATFIAMVLFLLGSCQCHDTTAPQQQNVSVSLNLSSATVNGPGQLKFTATVTGTTNTGVTWYVNDIAGGNSTIGTIDANGLYTAPVAVPSPASVTVKATSDADPSKNATSTVTIQASAGFLPVTGQTASYATGDDGNLKKGAAWPNPRFTVGTGEETDCVRDNLTGLMWVKSPDSITRTWPQALDYANNLSLCGYDDWRLPNRKELWSLIDRSKGRPALPAGNPFINVQVSSYWTSTTFLYSGSGDLAWPFNLLDGSTSGGINKVSTSLYVWPVRSGQIGAVAIPKTGQTATYATGDDGDLERGVAWPSPRFTAGTGLEVDCVTDNLTGLMWVKSPDKTTRTWQQALDNASGLSLCGYDDWRLPNINDLESVVNLGVQNVAEWLNSQGFSNLEDVSNCNYWTSSTYADNTDFAWRVAMCSGYVAGLEKNGSGYVWPVRTPGEASSTIAVHLFIGTDGTSGWELWGSDGTEAGTVRIKDINPGAGSSWPTVNAAYDLYYAVFNGKVYFSANDGTSGYELWKTDGTEAGTVRVKDIYPGTMSSSPYQYTSFNGALYFVADDGSGGRELWKTDGTEAGTLLVKDINPGTAGSTLSYLTVFNGALYFAANNGTSGVELWKTDGTDAGTVRVKDINPDQNSSDPSYLTVFNGALYFAADDGTNGVNLWKSDGTDAGTVRVKGVKPRVSGLNPYQFTVFNGALYFQALDGTSGYELWKSDGTDAGTVLVKDIYPGSGGSGPEDLTVFNGMLYFRAGDATNGVELWKSDGTEAGTVLVKDINPGSASSLPIELTLFNGGLYFDARDDTNGTELWKSDGTEAGTVRVKDINPGYQHSSPSDLAVFNGVLYFAPWETESGRELWRSDGTEAGTIRVKDVNPGPPDGYGAAG